MTTEHQIEENDKAHSQVNHDHDSVGGKRGSHVVGAGIGAVAGGVIGGMGTGAAIGTAAGPVGTAAGAAAGAVVGAIVGGYAGREVAIDIDPTVEHDFWRTNYPSRPYFNGKMPYDEFAPAYQYGWESKMLYNNKTFEQNEPDLARGWAQYRGKSTLQWDQAKHATRDSWERLKNRKSEGSKPQLKKDVH